jgi:hypothetical protein
MFGLGLIGILGFMGVVLFFVIWAMDVELERKQTRGRKRKPQRRLPPQPDADQEADELLTFAIMDDLSHDHRD